MPTAIGSSLNSMPEKGVSGGTQEAPQQREGGGGTKRPSIGVLEHKSQQDLLCLDRLADDLIGIIFNNVGLRHKVYGIKDLKLGGIALTEDDRRVINKQFLKAARSGELNVMKNLHKTFGLTKKEARANDNEAFRKAAANGHLEVLKWLHTTFDLKEKDARANNNDAFQWAANNGHLEVLEWLHTTFKLTETDARANNNGAFRCAAGRVIWRY